MKPLFHSDFPGVRREKTTFRVVTCVLTIESGGRLSKNQDVFVIFKVPENWGEAKEIGDSAQAEEKGLFRHKWKFRMAFGNAVACSWHSLSGENVTMLNVCFWPKTAIHKHSKSNRSVATAKSPLNGMDLLCNFNPVQSPIHRQLPKHHNLRNTQQCLANRSIHQPRDIPQHNGGRGQRFAGVDQQ